MARVVDCRACPRLVEWREEVARTKRAAFATEDYWGRPIPSFGDRDAWVAVVGLAPAAHGGNRTGRMFTGDRSGDWLYASMFRTGFANQPHAVSIDDGLRLTGVYVTAPVRCAPPVNKPTLEERDTCLPYLVRELELLPNVSVLVALGKFAWDAAITAVSHLGEPIPKPKPKFGHLAEAPLGRYRLLGSYHPSQQNTFTGKLTEEMLDAVFLRARELGK
ncbi:MAG: uracil-DNA glycosylase [Actinobacteria bacterium]|nr:uracil-DNA glycosylase [Actinomycetota bacterium]